MRILIIHGYKSSPEKNFFPWLKDALHAKGHEVIIPTLPNPEEPDPEEWVKALLEEVKAVDEETIIVGHSLGGATALRYLEAVEAHATPKACILISTPWMIQAEQLRGFFLSELDFDVLMWKASRFYAIHAKDDHVIPFDHAQKYHSVLHAKLVPVETGGHFQGTGPYPVILETIEKAIAEEIVYAPGESLDHQFDAIDLE